MLDGLSGRYGRISSVELTQSNQDRDLWIDMNVHYIWQAHDDVDGFISFILLLSD